MELRHLRYFLAVAEESHFGRAAERLGIQQPPLSRQIKDLEHELGFLLFDRSRRKVELTAAGTTLQQHARDLLQALERGLREARRASLGQRGRVVIGYPSSLAYTGLTELLRTFRQRFPEVEISVSELAPGDQIEALKNGQLDVGFLRGKLPDPRFSSQVLRREKLLLALPMGHRLAQRGRIALAAAAEEPFVFFPRARGPAFYDFVLQFCERSGVTPRIVQEAPQIDVLALVAAGFGVSILPASVRDLRRDDLLLRPLLGSPTTELRIAWRKNDTSQVLRHFVDTALEVGVKRRRRKQQ